MKQFGMNYRHFYQTFETVYVSDNRLTINDPRSRWRQWRARTVVRRHATLNNNVSNANHGHVIELVR